MKRLLKWALGLLVLAVVLAVVFFLSLDSILRLTMQHSIRRQTGLEAEIGSFHLGLTEPVVEIRHLRLFNTKQFGGTPFLEIPEIHVEYDLAALQKNEIHITLLRFNLGELDVVRSADGQTNLLSLGLLAGAPQRAPDAGAGAGALAVLKGKTDLEFKGIDCLNVSVGEFKYLDLGNPTNNRAQKINISNLVMTNVNSMADLAGLAGMTGLRGGDVFKPLLAPGDSVSGSPARDFWKLLTH